MQSAVHRAKASNNAGLIEAADDLVQRFAAFSPPEPHGLSIRDPAGTGTGTFDPFAGHPMRQARDVFGELGEELGTSHPTKPHFGGIAQAVRDAQEGGLMRGTEHGTVDVAIHPHKYARQVRKVLGVSGYKFESAHISPGTVLKALQRRFGGDYKYREADATLLPKAEHGVFDRFWKGFWRSKRASGVPEIKAGELMEKMTEGARNLQPKVTESGIAEAKLREAKIKGTMEWLLHLDFYKKQGLLPESKLPVPPPRARLAGLKTAGGIGLAGLGAALEYHSLTESGHGKGESIAQAVAGGLGSFAAPGGLAGLGLGLGSIGLEAGGAPGEAVAATKTTGDVLNLTGAALGQTARAGVNLVSGDTKAFDRQMKEMVQGKAGIPLEGYARSVDMLADIAPTAVDQIGAVMHGKSAKQAMGEIQDRVESTFLKQKFGSAEASLWNATGGPLLLRQVKFVEGIAQRKSLKEAAKGAQEMEKNAPIVRATDWAGEQAVQFVKKDIPEAAHFARRDLGRMATAATAAPAAVVHDAKKLAAKAIDALPAMPDPGKTLAQVAPMLHDVKEAAEGKLSNVAGELDEKLKKSKEMLRKYLPF